MTKNQINRLQMKKTVIATLGETAGSHAGVPAVGQCCDELAEVASTIEDLAVIQMSRSGFAEAKRTAKLQLGDLANEVAAAVVSYAGSIDDEVLAGRCKFSRSAITKDLDPEVIARCMDIHATATEVAGSLGEFGVTVAKLSSLKKKIDTFDNLSTKPRQAVGKSSSATKRLPTLFRQASRLLRLRLDKVMVQYQATQPDLYNRYRTARKVVDVSNAAPGNVVPTPAVNPVPKAA